MRAARPVRRILLLEDAFDLADAAARPALEAAARQVSEALAPVSRTRRSADGQTIQKIEPLEADGVKIMSMAFFVPAEKAVVWRDVILAHATTGRGQMAALKKHPRLADNEGRLTLNLDHHHV